MLSVRVIPKTVAKIKGLTLIVGRKQSRWLNAKKYPAIAIRNYLPDLFKSCVFIFREFKRFLDRPPRFALVV